jgi:hypothetical protein
MVVGRTRRQTAKIAVTGDWKSVSKADALWVKSITDLVTMVKVLKLMTTSSEGFVEHMRNCYVYKNRTKKKRKRSLEERATWFFAERHDSKKNFSWTTVSSLSAAISQTSGRKSVFLCH